MGINRSKIRLALDEKENVVDHIGVAYRDRQVFAGLKLCKGFIASEHTYRPDHVAQVDFHGLPIFLGDGFSNKLAIPSG
jgi:hypothetical protein